VLNDFQIYTGVQLHNDGVWEPLRVFVILQWEFRGQNDSDTLAAEALVIEF